MKLLWIEEGWEDYSYWQKTDKKVVKKINTLIKDAMRTPFEGIGKPESLKHSLSGWWSRRIDIVHRLVYKHENETLIILSCRKHLEFSRRISIPN